jgi:hypothetical protein
MTNAPHLKVNIFYLRFIFYFFSFINHPASIPWTLVIGHWIFFLEPCALSLVPCSCLILSNHFIQIQHSIRYYDQCSRFRVIVFIHFADHLTGFVRIFFKSIQCGII